MRPRGGTLIGFATRHHTTVGDGKSTLAIAETPYAFSVCRMLYDANMPSVRFGM
jgi:hypothetical protein